MNKKGAIGLSINFIVIVIISLVILGAGISLLYKLIGGADEIKSDLDSQTETQLERLLTDQGKKVALTTHSASIEAGKTKVFGLGILNIDAKSYKTSFSLKIELCKALDKSDLEITPKPATSTWLVYDAGPFTIQENSYQKTGVLVKPPANAKKGTYIFNAKVTDGNGKLYDNIKKFSVIIK